MTTTLIAQFISPTERVGAVHKHFAGRDSGDGLQIIFVTLIGAVVLCGLLLVLSRIQQRKQRRRQAEHDQHRRELTAPRQQFMTLGQKRTSAGRT